MSYLGLAAATAACAAVAYKLRGKGLFYVAYFLYTLPPVGGYIHRKALEKTRAGSKHTDCDSDAVLSFLDGPSSRKLAVRPVPFMSDNYAYLIIDYASGAVAAVDPADAKAVVDAVAVESERSNQRLRITDVLVTHYHMDHAGGNHDLRTLDSRIRVYGSSKERNFGVPGTTIGVQDGSVIPFAGLEISVAETPGHTQGHVSFCIPIQPGCETAAVFTGDALFVAGAGKFFEGTGDDAIRSMKYYRSLRADTLVFPGHEYTADNFDFACWVEPDNEALAARRDWAHRLREHRMPTVPVTLEHEFAHNPFLRFDDADLVAALPDAERRAKSKTSEEAVGLRADASPAAVLQTLRDLKDAGAYRATE